LTGFGSRERHQTDSLSEWKTHVLDVKV